MAGPLDIQRLPYGLVDLLGMKGTGDTPHNLAELVAVTLADGADYYLSPRRVTVTGDSAINLALGWQIAVGCSPGPGEIWLVYNMTVSVNQATAAATAIKFWGGKSQASGTAADTQWTESMALGAADWDSRSRCFERPQLVIPGDVLGFRVGTITGAPAVKGRMTLDVARLSL